MRLPAHWTAVPCSVTPPGRRLGTGTGAVPRQPARITHTARRLATTLPPASASSWGRRGWSARWDRLRSWRRAGPGSRAECCWGQEVVASGNGPCKTPPGPSPPYRQGSPPTPWALRASFAGTAARAVEGAGQVWFTLLLSGACSPLFLALLPGLGGLGGPAVCCSGLGPARGEGWKEWVTGPVGPHP